MRRSRCVSRMNLDQIVAAAFEPVNLLVGHALGQPCQLRVLAKKVVAVKAAVLGRKSLHLAINGIGKGRCQRAGQIACE